MSPDELDELTGDPSADQEDGSTSPSVHSVLGTPALSKYESLVADLQVSSETSRWRFGKSGSPLDHLHDIGRLVMRFHGPYLETSQAVTVGLTICAAATPDEVKEHRMALSTRLYGTAAGTSHAQTDTASEERSAEAKKWKATLDAYTNVGKWLLTQYPDLQAMLKYFDEDGCAMSLLGRFLDYHARQGRTADIRTLKENISQWISTVTVELPSGDSIIFTPHSPADGKFDRQRANWGWNSPWSARLLIWLSARGQFDENVEGSLEGLRNGHIKMNHNGFPAFLYDDSTAPVSTDVRDFQKGLFRGPVLIAAYRCIWTSPESSTNPPGVAGSGRASISRKNCITQVTGESISYVACLIRHVLSSENHWCDQNANIFDGAIFFAQMVKLFKHEVFAAPILDIFKRQVYGITTSTVDVSEEPNQFDILDDQLAASEAPGGYPMGGGDLE
ncbi:hypothetical protein C8Q73DRAFT_796307 [Cubamyces lactineus]|nr:hypothetical protein C8Q73DRAFT_796307 [Cubamyces lactineus]